MPIDLPADSLGPKPTKKQMELLKRMAVPEAIVRTWTGVTLGSGGTSTFTRRGKLPMRRSAVETWASSTITAGWNTSTGTSGDKITRSPNVAGK